MVLQCATTQAKYMALHCATQVRINLARVKYPNAQKKLSGSRVKTDWDKRDSYSKRQQERSYQQDRTQ
ncbi:hypothetical protein GGTG_13382 [Gaeumannomyces tritici R3-111a-1]|uniref:Uncharacterized protein n=1 Tax=Gaeumannomyces tritici (strain R3-111a-1) TaxID=644352 RepID=J3PIQ3_GAET3|nr:hypothetical protein GGTG_13382 [Gaeumannomyces tritici R3-111a-1]EJT69114.1 hypothetical protein GGTG_13382 [Gaeumannomyces tritici R3-111a-1]